MTRLVTTLALVAAVALAGCSDDGTGPENRVEGTYALETIDGDELPVTMLATGEFQLEVLAGEVRLMDEGEMRFSITFRESLGDQSGTYTEADSGTWTRSGDTITFAWDDEEDAEFNPTSGIYANGRLTIDMSGFTMVYEK